MATKIDTVTARNKLAVRREPYWHRIRKGLQVGFRKMSATSEGNWQFRHIDDVGGKAQVSLGTLDDYPAHERYDRAVASALNWLSKKTGVGPPSSRPSPPSCMRAERTLNASGTSRETRPPMMSQRAIGDGYNLIRYTR
jgi:hypothetical protein